MLRDTMSAALDLGLNKKIPGTTETEHIGQEACGNLIYDTFSN